MKAIQVFIAALLMAGLLLPASPVRADSVIHVNTSADNNTSGDGLCTLREAIINANNNASSYPDCNGGSGTDTIDFNANYTITLSGPMVNITSPIIIYGRGSINTIIQASECNPVTLPLGCTPADWRVFQVADVGDLTINGITVRYGKAADFGGGISANAGVLHVDYSVIKANKAGSAGGGVFGYGSVHLTGSTISNNASGGDGGGVYNFPPGSMTIEDSTISGNTASWGAGIGNNSTLTMTNSIISGNIASAGGGGMYNYFGRTVTITGSTFADNHSTQGAGISSDGTVTLTNSTVDSNISSDYGGGIYSSGTFTVANSTISLNQATGSGGGIYNYPGATLAVRNSTISGNSGNAGGGISAWGTTTILNSTISNNTAVGAGGLYNAPGATLNFANTIVANSTGPEDCFNAGAIGTNTNNLVEDGTCSALYMGDPGLAPLAQNGGSTKTHALLPGSLAMEIGDATTCANAPISGRDQRGAVRPGDGNHDGTAACDIGAHESYNVIAIGSGTQDGWILESSESSTSGGTMSSTAGYVMVGDDASDRQYRAVLSFDVSGIPVEADIVGATLKIKRQGPVVGTSPFDTHGRLLIDMKKPYFGAAASLGLDDFNFLAGRSGAASFNKRASSGWYSARMNSTAYSYINRNGRTQFRLRFALGDDDDLSADYYKFYSGDAATAGYKPMLVLEYFVPPVGP